MGLEPTTFCLARGRVRAPPTFYAARLSRKRGCTVRRGAPHLCVLLQAFSADSGTWLETALPRRRSRRRDGDDRDCDQAGREKGDCYSTNRHLSEHRRTRCQATASGVIPEHLAQTSELG